MFWQKNVPEPGNVFSQRCATRIKGTDSGIFRDGITMDKAIASQMRQGRFNPFEDAGHILFYEQRQKFNAALIDFVIAP